MTDFETLRLAMVEGQLRAGGVIDRTVLAAMGRVPREAFVSDAQRPFAYIDEALPLSASRMLPAPAAFGLLVQLAALHETDTVLDVACGTGYSTAVLARLAGAVTGIEEDEALARTARSTLDALDVAVPVIQTALSAPELTDTFDVIIVAGALDLVPHGLFDRLAEGGRLVTAMGRGPAAIATVFTATEGVIARTNHFSVGLPSLPAFAQPAGFTF